MNWPHGSEDSPFRPDELASASPSDDGARQKPERAFVEKVCPFCGENDFDAWGLKLHLSQGGCDVYNETTREKRILEAIAEVAPPTPTEKRRL